MRHPVSISALAVGSQGERAAADYLTRRGYHVLERNFRCVGGEVDLIALDGGTLIFVEVKLRRSQVRGAPIEGVTLAQQKRIRKAAQVYLSYSGRIFQRIRFDIVCVAAKGRLSEITHLKAAFSSA